MHDAMSSAFKIFNIFTQCPDDQKHGVWQNLDWAHITIKAIKAPGANFRFKATPSDPGKLGRGT
jgi:hypothetical protein